MPPESISLDALFRALVREELRGVVRAELAPLVDRVDALAAAAPATTYTVAQAAERLGLSPATVRRRLEDGSLPGVKLGRAWRVDLAAIGRRSRPEEIAEFAAEARRG